jgi:hypothetical protein
MQRETPLVESIPSAYRMIESSQPFNKRTMTNMLRSLTDTEYEKEEIQRILRFVRVKEGLSEYEYAEAEALAGRQPRSKEAGGGGESTLDPTGQEGGNTPTPPAHQAEGSRRASAGTTNPIPRQGVAQQQADLLVTDLEEGNT